MIHLGRFCCICFKDGYELEKLSMIRRNGLSYHEKLSMLIPQADIDEIKEVVYICEECRICIDEMYSFRETCVRNNVMLWVYITKLRADKNSKFTDSFVLDKLSEKQFQRYRNIANDSELSDFENTRVKTESIDESVSPTNVLNNEQRSIDIDLLNIDIKQETEIPNDDFYESDLIIDCAEDVTTEIESINNPILPPRELNSEKRLENDDTLNIDIKSEVPDHLYENNSITSTVKDADIHKNKEVKTEDVSSLHTEFDIKHIINQKPYNDINTQSCRLENFNANLNIETLVDLLSGPDNIIINADQLSKNINGGGIQGNKEVKTVDTSSLHTELNIEHIKNEKPYNVINAQNYRLVNPVANPNIGTNVVLMSDSIISHNCRIEYFDINTNRKVDVDFIFEHKPNGNVDQSPNVFGAENDKSLYDNGFGANSLTQPMKQCDVCKKTFSNDRALKYHKKIHIGGVPHKCDICNKTFIRLFSLLVHNRVHSSDGKPYKCDKCNKSFRRLSELDQHIKAHTDVKTYKCEICSKSFSHNYILQRHITVHNNDKPYKCHICNKSFKRLFSFNVHSKIHADYKPYKCHVCDKSFVENFMLKRHIRTHTGDKPHKCNICSKSFMHCYDLNRHSKVHKSRY